MVLPKVFHVQPSNPGPNRLADADRLAQWAVELAAAIERNCPPCEDRNTAIAKLREAIFYAREAIVLEGHV